jgi:hypothetical protein
LGVFLRLVLFKMKPDNIARCAGYILLLSQISLGGFDAGMTQGELYLLQLRTAFPGKVRKGPAQVVS